MPSIDVNGTTLHYEDDGPIEAPALVLSPSMFFDSRMFARQAEAFADRYRVIRYDLRGQGESARHPREELDLDLQAQDAAELVEALGVAPCTFVGSSMGGLIGLRLAARRPDLVCSVVVLGASADAEEAAEPMDALAEVLAAHGMEPVLDPVLHLMLGDTTLTDPSRADVLAGARELLLTRTPEYADSVWQVAHRKPILDELPLITVPLTVVAGAEDRTCPPPRSEQIVALVPHARYVVLERTGHVPAWENPEAVTAVLEEHLAALG